MSVMDTVVFFKTFAIIQNLAKPPRNPHESDFISKSKYNLLETLGDKLAKKILKNKKIKEKKLNINFKRNIDIVRFSYDCRKSLRFNT